MKPPHLTNEWYFRCRWFEGFEIDPEDILNITNNILRNGNWAEVTRNYHNKFHSECKYWSYYFHVKEWSDGTFTAE
jgi:hypothetical protein